MSKLDAGQRHLMRLTLRDADIEGWAKVSKIVWPFVQDVPDELLEKRESNEGGHVRLTDSGKAVLTWT